MPGPSIVIVADDSPELLATRVSAALGVALHQGESSHYGDPYFSAWPDSELKLTLNCDPLYLHGEDPPEERFFVPTAQDAPFVLWNADPEHEAVARLRTEGLDARLAIDST